LNETRNVVAFDYWLDAFTMPLLQPRCVTRRHTI